MDIEKEIEKNEQLLEKARELGDLLAIARLEGHIAALKELQREEQKGWDAYIDMLYVNYAN